MVEQRWGSKKGLQSHKEESEVEEDRADKEGSEDGPGESQKKETLLSAFCQYSGFVFLVYFSIFYFVL